MVSPRTHRRVLIGLRPVLCHSNSFNLTTSTNFSNTDLVIILTARPEPSQSISGTWSRWLWWWWSSNGHKAALIDRLLLILWLRVPSLHQATPCAFNGISTTGAPWDSLTGYQRCDRG